MSYFTKFGAMDLLQNRLREVDGYMAAATVSVMTMTEAERKLASDLCEHVDLPMGSLVRRANAVRLAGGQDNFGDCLREAAHHLIFRAS